MPHLMALEPLPRDDWLTHIESLLAKSGKKVERKGTELYAWEAELASGPVRYADGWRIRRVWLAAGRSAIGVLAQRIYFREEGGSPDLRPERAVLAGAPRPDSPLALDQVRSQWGLLQQMKENIRPPTNPVELESVDPDLRSARVVQIGAYREISPPARLNALYREHGFDSAPDDLMVSVCPLESVSGEVAVEFARRLERAGAQRKLRMKVRTTEEDSVSSLLKNPLNNDRDAMSQ